MMPNASGGVSPRGISLQDDSSMSPYNSLHVVWECNFVQSARQQLNDMHSRPSYYLLPRAHAQGVKQSVCLSVVVVVVVFVFSTKIARSRVLGICASSKHNQSVDIGEKLVYTHFELLKKAYQCYKSCIFCSACLWFIDHTHSFSMLIILRMLKLNLERVVMS